MKRTRWLATGVALGAGGTIWAKKRLESVQGRLDTNGIISEVAGATRERVRAAVDAGRKQAERREAEIRTNLEGRQKGGR